RDAVLGHLREVLHALPPPPARATVVGVAGTVTTLFAVQHAVEPYDAARVHGGTLTRAELAGLLERLCSLTVEERRRLPGLQPKRADVIPVGALILLASLEQLGAEACRVSDRGLRWGLLASRFGTRRV
ncbi:MAG: Ppx/GppA family phosphatase, partial [Myxococcaceae bacterium]|nr:Ppx/GppA family phosphatase [Myxococcaceae bacterium]